MATITITDDLGLTADLAVRDDSPFAKARGTKLVLAAASLVGDFVSPVDQINFSKGAFGAAFADPSLLMDGAVTLAINATLGGALSVSKPADKALFGDDGVSPSIPIAADQCWIGVEIDGTLGGGASAAIEGFGVGISGSAAVSLGTYTLVPGPGGSFPLLKDCLGPAIDNFSVATSAAAIRKQKNGTVNCTDISGTITFTGSYSLPLNVNSLASANLPFNYQIEVIPSETLQISGSIAVSGDFVVRSYKVSDAELRIGVYKKQGATLTAAFTASAGIQAEHKTTDLLASVLGAAFPGADPDRSGIAASDAALINDALQQSLNRSVSIALNLACSASRTNEAAVLYSIDLSSNAAQTDAAIASALRGDWTLIDGLPNARALRNVVKNSHEFQHKLTLNLLGIYNAASISDFTRSCTVLHDETGAIVITDNVSASRIATAQSPTAADPDKLRSALADAFLATVTYSATAAGGLKPSLTASQTYFAYKQSMSRQEMNDAFLLGRQLGLLPPSDWNQTLPAFVHARVSVSAHYDGNAALRLFFADPTAPAARTQADLERTGRSVMLSLIDPADPAGQVRRATLANDQAWAAMDETGATASFGTISELSGLFATDLAAVAADWVSIRWWTDSMVQLGNQLTRVISAAANSTAKDPTADPNFMASRDKLQMALAAVTRNAHAAFVGGWGLAVMAAESGMAPDLTMDLAWDGAAKHYERPGLEASQTANISRK